MASDSSHSSKLRFKSNDSDPRNMFISGFRFSSSNNENSEKEDVMSCHVHAWDGLWPRPAFNYKQKHNKCNKQQQYSSLSLSPTVNLRWPGMVSRSSTFDFDPDFDPLQAPPVPVITTASSVHQWPIDH